MFLRSLLFLCLFGLTQSVVGFQYETFEESGKVGMKESASGLVVINPVYEDIGWSDKSEEVVNWVIGAVLNEKWAMVDLKGKKVTSHEFIDLYPISQNQFIASKRPRYSIIPDYGALNNKGKEVLPFEYADLQLANDLLIGVKRTNGRYRTGLLSKAGKLVVPIEYKSISPLGDNHFVIENEQGLSALYGKTGESLTEFHFETIESYDEAHLLITRFGRKGLLSTAGDIVIQPIYEQFELDGTNAQGLPFKKWDLYNESTFINSFYYDHVNILTKDLLVGAIGNSTSFVDHKDENLSYQKERMLLDSKQGLTVVKNTETGYQGVLRNENTVLPINYDSVVLYEQFFAANIKKPAGNDWLVFEHKGQKLNTSGYDWITDFDNGHFLAKRSNKLGLLNKDGTELSPFIYDKIGHFTHGLAIVDYLGNKGVINKKGHWVITPYSDFVQILPDHIFLKQASEYKITDHRGHVLVRSYDDIKPLPQGYFINEEGELSLYNLKDERLLEPVYDSITAIHSNLYLLSRDDKLFFYRPGDRADFRLESDIDSLGELKNGYIPVLKDNQWGFLDSLGNLRIANRYEAVQFFSDDLAGVKLIGKWGYVNPKEELVIQPSYDSIEPFEDGLAVVARGNMYGLINKSDNLILGLSYSGIKRERGYITLESNGLIGLADKAGNLIKTPQYESLKSLKNGHFLVSKNGLKGVINLNGEDVVPIAYQEITQFNNLFLASENSDWVKLNLGN